jgi:2'-5' RNA ligase
VSTTIGVAVPVPEPFGSLLREARASFGDPMASTVPTHITLTPPIEIDEPRLAALPANLHRATDDFPAYGIRLRGTGTFRPISPVVFVAVSEGISQTELLARRIRAALGITDLDFPYHPHVTVAHHLPDSGLDRAFDALAQFECQFRVADFALYHHDAERGWEPQQRFGLLET